MNVPRCLIVTSRDTSMWFCGQAWHDQILISAVRSVGVRRRGNEEVLHKLAVPCIIKTPQEHSAMSTLVAGWSVMSALVAGWSITEVLTYDRPLVDHLQLWSPVSDLLNNLSARATVTLVTAITGISVGNVEKLLIFVHKAKPKNCA